MLICGQPGGSQELWEGCLSLKLRNIIISKYNSVNDTRFSYPIICDNDSFNCKSLSKEIPVTVGVAAGNKKGCVKKMTQPHGHSRVLY